MRDKGVPLKSLGWIGIAAIGAIGGLMLGRFVVGENVPPVDDSPYAQVTGNPDAFAIESVSTALCYDCANGSGVRLDARAGREERMDKAFRKLGAVAPASASNEDEDYDYGGRFDDPAAARTLTMRLPVPVPAEAVGAPDIGAGPASAPPASPPPVLEDPGKESQPLD